VVRTAFADFALRATALRRLRGQSLLTNKRDVPLDGLVRYVVPWHDVSPANHQLDYVARVQYFGTKSLDLVFAVGQPALVSPGLHPHPLVVGVAEDVVEIFYEIIGYGIHLLLSRRLRGLFFF
jgi:hypothetical protein